MSDSKFLLDENIPKSIKKLLESKGFLLEYSSKSISDIELSSLAKKQKSVIIPRDSDFLNTSLFPPKSYLGIIVFTIHPPKADKLVKALTLFLSQINKFKGKAFAIEEEGFKVIES